MGILNPFWLVYNSRKEKIVVLVLQRKAKKHYEYVFESVNEF